MAIPMLTNKAANSFFITLPPYLGVSMPGLTGASAPSLAERKTAWFAESFKRNGPQAYDLGRCHARMTAANWAATFAISRSDASLIQHWASASKCLLLADRGYDADWIRAFVTERGAWANIPPKRNRKDPICFSPYLYRDRNLVEQFFNKIKQCRRVATRYDKLAANYLAFVKLACIRLWLRVYECTA
jgi:transposase